jgi:hypothetical protein
MFHTDPAPRFFCLEEPSEATPRPSGREDLYAWLRRHLFADLQAPVTVREFRNRHLVTVMRGIEVLVCRRGRRIEVRGRRGAGDNDWLSGRMRLNCPLRGSPWAAAWWWSVRPMLPPLLSDVANGIGPDSLSAWIDHTARCSGLLGETRRKVLQSLRLDPGLLRRARALCTGPEFNTDDYVFVWKRARASRLREREAPRLWPLYGIMRRKHWAPTAEIGRVCDYLRREGLTKGGWKMLCRHGRALWWPMRHCHEFHRNPLREVIALANLLAASGRRDLPPPALALTIARLRSMSPHDGGDGTANLLPLIRVAWQHMDTLLDASARAAFARGTLESMMVAWHGLGSPAPPPKGAGMAWFERRCAQLQLRVHGKDVAWCSMRLSARTVDGFEILPLTQLSAVRAAGFLLRNCMAQATTAEANNSRHALFLMTDADGRALAMFSTILAEDGTTGRLADIRGRFNQPADKRFHQAAQDYLAGR